MSAEQEASPYELLETADDVVRYLESQGLLGRLTEPDAAGRSLVEVREVTAGNMNRVFIARGPLGSLAVKQAPPWVQVVGPEWPVDPGRIASEARTYERLALRVPDSIPQIVAFDEARYALVMEDLSDLVVLRDALVAEVGAVGAVTVGAATDAGAEPLDYEQLGRVVGRFVGELVSSTSRAALGEIAHDELVALSANPELCALTHDVVLDEPYREHEHNRWHPALEGRVRQLYRDEAVHAAVAGIRSTFDQSHEGLLHGDLHTGSVMVGRRDGRQIVKVFDPEFSFVGPIGMDLGLFWANLELAAIAASAVGDEALAAARRSAVTASWAAFGEAWLGAGLPVSALPGIEADSWRFAGVEGLRRAVGFSHAADLETLPDAVAGPANVSLFDAARHHILTGTAVPTSFAAAPTPASAPAAPAHPHPKERS